MRDEERPREASQKIEAEPKKDAPGSKTSDDLSMEALLNEATGGAGPDPVDTETGKPAVNTDKLPKKLSRAAIKKGMRAVVPRVQSCFAVHQVAGKVAVRLTIEPDGSVSGASSTGDAAGTPTGTCVADAVSRASFPAWNGAPLTFSYPFILQ